ncbi:LLM class flavin-dependent oxidoreductase [Streptomyces sp. NPDC049577]|uniref:LLM class flavin-dependent oxidoreductase n=1 Tax=Streptomyces sp. NPDC049577 TaxID=3155153 RepID=UPI003424048E
MRFGLFCLPAECPGHRPSAAETYAGLVDAAVEAERLGLHAVWFAEHHFSPYGGFIPSIPVLGAAVAARTERIRIGSAATVLPLRDAVETAESFAMLDVLSGGRVEVGVGRGFLPAEFAGRGVAMTDRAGLFTEGLAVLRGAWADGPLRFRGEHYDLEGVDVLPKPAQRPGPPVWIAASTSRDSFELAGREGLGLMVNPYNRSAEELAAGLGWYREARRAAGLDPEGGRILANQHLFVAPTETEAATVPREPLMEYLGAVDAAFGRPLTPPDYAAVYPEKVLFGTPDTVTRKIKEWERLGITDLCLMTRFGSLAPAAASGSLRLFAREVAPCFG